MNAFKQDNSIATFSSTAKIPCYIIKSHFQNKTKAT